MYIRQNYKIFNQNQRNHHIFLTKAHLNERISVHSQITKKLVSNPPSGKLLTNNMFI